MKFGVFDHMDRRLAPLDRLYEERLKLVEAYDRAGFTGIMSRSIMRRRWGWHPRRASGSPPSRSGRNDLRFGPLVYLLPLYHPIKLLEEICMLDQISGGRLMLGVGRGISPIELRYYGLDPEQTPAMYAEALEVILRGMTSQVLNFEGKYYQYHDVPMEMTPFQTPHPRCGTASGGPRRYPGRRAQGEHRRQPARRRDADADATYRAEWEAAATIRRSCR